MSENIGSTDPGIEEVKTGWSWRRKVSVAIGSIAAVSMVSAFVSHEVWPKNPDGLTTEISINGSVEHFMITNTSRYAGDGPRSTDTLLEGTLDCSRYAMDGVDAAVELPHYLSASDEQVMTFKEGAVAACDPGHLPRYNSGWYITQAFVQSGLGAY